MSVDTRKMGEEHFTFVSGRVVGARLEPLVLANRPHFYHSTMPKAPSADAPAGYELWAAEPAPALAQLTPAVRALIAAQQPAKVRVAEDEVTVTWPGIATDAAEIERAMRLCASLATGARSAYR